MKFHSVFLPHTLPTADYCHCAYTQKQIGFTRMMRSLGHTVFEYVSDAPLPPEENQAFPFHVEDPRWQRQNARAIEQIRANMEPRDILCLIAGLCQKPIADAFPMLQAVEYGIGYFGVFAPYRVFESYFHMANVYGQTRQARGGFYDAVIPNYYDPADFPLVEKKDPYLLFVGRLNEDKGIHVAVDVAKRAGLPLVVAGQGTPPAGVDYRGRVGVTERAHLMGHATALLAPTLYLEPFGGVAVEAQIAGTAAIVTDWGAFPETVEQGVTGFRCHYLGEFVDAVHLVAELDPVAIRARAIAKYSLDVVRHQYDSYFRRVLSVWEQGWLTETLV